MAIAELDRPIGKERGGLLHLMLDVLTLPGSAFPPPAGRLVVPLVAVLSTVNLLIAWASLGPSKAYSLLTVERAGKALAPYNEYILLQAVTVATLMAGLAVPPLLWLLQSVCARFGGLFLDRGIRFRQVFLVAALAGIPVSVGNVLKAVLVNLKPPAEFVRVQSGLAWLADGLPEKSLGYFALSHLDPFGLWSLALLGYGLARLYRRPTWHGWSAVFGVWALILIVMRAAQ